MPDPTPDLTLDAEIRRANQYRHDAIERPADAAVLDFLADLALAAMRERADA